jgi:hypothetical protein
VSTVPADDEAVLMTVPPELPAAAGLPAAAPLAADDGADAALLLPPLLQAAASSATPTAPPTPAASFAGTGMRLIVELRMVFASRPARQAAPGFCFARWLLTELRAGTGKESGGKRVNQV